MTEISYGTYAPAEKTNEYAAEVAKFAAHAEKHPDATLVIKVPVEDAIKTKGLIQKAANALPTPKTAKVRHTDESGVKENGVDADGATVFVGDVVLTFTLNPLHKSRRNKAREDAAKAEKDSAE